MNTIFSNLAVFSPCSYTFHSFTAIRITSKKGKETDEIHHCRY